MVAATPLATRRCHACDETLPPSRFPVVGRQGERDNVCAPCLEAQERPPQRELELLDEVAGQTWHAYARCRSVDPELFYPEKGDAMAPNRVAAICGNCPVQGDCAEWAVAYEKHGWWGGISERTLQEVRAGRNAGEPLPTPLPGERIDDVRARANAEPAARAA